MYKCSICRKSTEITEDSVHVMFNNCTLTKGCQGILQKISQSRSAFINIPNSNIASGGAQPILITDESESKYLSISNSSVNTLILAVSGAKPPISNYVAVMFEKRKIADLTSQQFEVIAVTGTNTISGKDINGKNIRFDQAKSSNSDVEVYINGVLKLESTYTVYNNRIDFIPAENELFVINRNDRVVMLVKPVVVPELFKSIFKWNGLDANTPIISAWSNVEQVKDKQEYLNVFSSMSNVISEFSEYKIQEVYFTNLTGTTNLGTIQNSKLLLSRKPNSNYDRYLQSYISSANLTSGYNIKRTDGDAIIEIQLITDLAIPLVLSSITNNDIISNNQYTETQTLVQSTKIIGPI